MNTPRPLIAALTLVSSAALLAPACGGALSSAKECYERNQYGCATSYCRKVLLDDRSEQWCRTAAPAALQRYVDQQVKAKEDEVAAGNFVAAIARLERLHQFVSDQYNSVVPMVSGWQAFDLAPVEADLAQLKGQGVATYQADGDRLLADKDEFGKVKKASARQAVDAFSECLKVAPTHGPCRDGLAAARQAAVIHVGLIPFRAGARWRGVMGHAKRMQQEVEAALTQHTFLALLDLQFMMRLDQEAHEFGTVNWLRSVRKTLADRSLSMPSVFAFAAISAVEEEVSPPHEEKREVRQATYQEDAPAGQIGKRVTVEGDVTVFMTARCVNVRAVGKLIAAHQGDVAATQVFRERRCDEVRWERCQGHRLVCDPIAKAPKPRELRPAEPLVQEAVDAIPAQLTKMISDFAFDRVTVH